MRQCDERVHLDLSLAGRGGNGGRGAALDQNARGAVLERRAIIKDHHPYDLPEVIALPLTAGLAPYLEWVERETEQGQRNLEQP